MLVMAAIGLALALATVKWRRHNDFRAKRDSSPPATSAEVTLGGLDGLGFLPEHVNVVAAIQVADLASHSPGKKLLEPPRPPLVEMLLATIEKWTRLKIEQLDSIVVGTEIKDKLPQVTVVVETRQPYDVEALARALRPSVPTLQRGQPLFRFALNPGEGMLWCPRPRSLVLLFRLDALKMADLEAIPLAPREGDEALPRPVREMTADQPQRFHRQGLVWIAARLPEADITKELLGFAHLPPAAETFLTKVQAFGLNLRADKEGLTLSGSFLASDEKSTDVIRKQLEGLPVVGPASLKVTAAPPGVQGPDARWVSLQIRGGAEVIRRVMGKSQTK
jgi:hypothetical protein